MQRIAFRAAFDIPVLLLHNNINLILTTKLLAGCKDDVDDDTDEGWHSLSPVTRLSAKLQGINFLALVN